MHFFIIVLVFCLFVFLFCLHYTAREDFFLLRKNVTMEKLFNLAFLLSGLMLFGSRFFYVLFHFSKTFFNPFVFFLFPYFPGLSFGGAVLVGVIFFWYIARLRKMPLGKVFDFFMLSFLAALPVGFFGLFLLEGHQQFRVIHLIMSIGYVALFVIFLKFLLPKAAKLQDGTLGISAFFVISLFSFLENFVTLRQQVFTNREAIIFICLLFLDILLLVRQKGFLSAFKKLR